MTDLMNKSPALLERRFMKIYAQNVLVALAIFVFAGINHANA
jgi:hypothetical protein